MDADSGLVKAAAEGSREAFDELVRRYQGEMLNVARAMTSGDAEAEDLAQEAFVRAWRSLRTFRGDSSFRTWLYGITLNVIRTHQGRRSKRAHLWWSPRDARADRDPHIDPLERHAADIDLEQSLAVQDAIDRALATLPGDMREAVTLRDVQGLDYKEIAVVLGVPLGTVESRIFRARQRLRPLLEPLMKRHS